MHPVREYVYTPAENWCVHTHDGDTDKLEYAYETLTSFSYGLQFSKGQNPKLSRNESHVLPELGIKVSRHTYWRGRSPEDFDYYVDVARISERGGRWVVRDLYLDVLVYEGVRAEIVDTDEYLAAIEEGHLNADEAAFALTTAHALLNGLAKYGYSLEAYLQAEGVTLAWPKLKSTR